MGTIQIDGSTPKLTIGNATAEDALIVFDGNAQDFYIGLDDSADDLVIGLGSAAGTTPAISINEDRDVTISDGAIDFDVASHDTSNGLKLGGTLVTATAAELNIMDGVTATAAEINLIDGGTARGTTAIADGDGVLINDAGTMRMTTVQTLATYIGGSDPASADGDTLGTASLEWSDLYLADSSVIYFGNDQDTTLTHTDGTGLTLNSTNKLCFNDASQFIQGASATVLDIAATDEIELTATLLDVNANLDVSGTSLLPTLGVINEKDLGIGLHIKEGDSGASVHADSDHLVIEASGNCGISILGGTSSDCSIVFGDSGDNDINKMMVAHGTNSFMFYTAAEEHVRFQGSTQKVMLNYGETSVTGNVAFDVAGQASATTMALKHKDASGGTGIAFTDGDNQACGNIAIDGDGNAVAYNTSSDYRLKENVNYDFDATTELKKLKPAKFNWKNNPSLTIEGFLAHEVSSVVPLAVTGSKDATETRQDVVIGKSGNIWKYGILEEEHTALKNKVGADDEMKESTWYAEKEIPVYQVIDQSKLIPIMVKTIQELEARLKTLEDA